MIKYRIFVKGAPLEVFDLIKKEIDNNCPKNYKEYIKQQVQNFLRLRALAYLDLTVTKEE